MDFWERFDKFAAEAKETPIGKIMTARNFHVQHIGGGCSAWARPIDDTGMYIWVCDEGNGLGDRTDETYLVGLYTKEGEYWINDDAPSLDKALEIIDRWQAWPREYMLAHHFAEALMKHMTAKQWETMRERNRSETDPMVCHSHDFCDANMVMDQAWRDVLGLPAIDADDEEQAKLWSMAWNIAKENYL